MADYSNRIKGLRKEKGLTQQELAASVGITKQAISMYERGDRKPSFDALDALTDFFGVSIGYLTGSSDVRGTYPRHGIVTSLTAEEQKILQAYAAASTEIKAAVRAVLGLK